MALPERIGKYPIVRVLGEGAMGVVYEAFDPVIRRALAIKTIRRDLIESDTTGAAAVARFKTEAQAAGSLAHPGIASVYEYGEDDRCAYIAMEFVSGNTLREYITRKTAFAEEDVMAIMSSLLEALGFAHARRILHRDIKPANLMITRDGRLKITDFGIARVEANGVTMAGAVIGTPGYMAPEQFSGDHIDHRVDVYAAAASLYQVLTGQLPFTGSIEQVMYKTVMHEPAPPSSIDGAQRWRHLDAVVLRALARDRDQRFESAQAFRDALLAVARQPGGATVSEQTLIMEWVRPDAAGRATGAGSADTAGRESASSATGGAAPVSTASMPLPDAWDPGTLARIEGELARHIGPLAKVLVRRAARETTDMGGLRERLARHLGSAAERTAFLTAAAVSGAPAGVTQRDSVGALSRPLAVLATTADDPGERGSDEVALSSWMREQSALVLARRVGPIAGLLVRRAAAAAHGRAGFIDSLVAMAAESTDRDGLLTDLRGLAARDPGD